MTTEEVLGKGFGASMLTFWGWRSKMLTSLVSDFFDTERSNDGKSYKN